MPAKEINSAHVLVEENVSVDLSMLYDVSGDDETYIRKMIEIFLNNTPGIIERVEKALQQQDWEEVYQAAHLAKSSLSIIKVSDMLESAVSIEISANKNQDRSTIPSKIEILKSNFNIARRLLVAKFK